MRAPPGRRPAGRPGGRPGAGAIDLDELGVWVAVPRRHKRTSRGKPRWLVLGPKARAVLAPYLDRPAGEYCFSPREAAPRPRRVPAGPRAPGGRYSPRTYRQAVARACAAAGVPAWSPYQFRHLFAAEVDYRLGLDAAQASLGHEKPDVTRRYTKRNFRLAADVALEMG